MCHIVRLLLRLGVTLSVSLLHTAHAMELITAAESQLPAAELVSVRGPFPAPEIEVIAPVSNFDRQQVPERYVMIESVKVPLRLVLRFKPHGGAKVDMDSLSVKYIKNPFVDLTERVRPYVTATGVTVPEANMPAGNHLVRIQVRDSAGRLGTTFLELRAAE